MYRLLYSILMKIYIIYHDDVGKVCDAPGLLGVAREIPLLDFLW